MRTAEGLLFGHWRYGPDWAGLLDGPDNSPALWVERQLQPNGSYSYTLNDNNCSTELPDGEDLDADIADWKSAVEWDEEEA